MRRYKQTSLAMLLLMLTGVWGGLAHADRDHEHRERPPKSIKQSKEYRYDNRYRHDHYYPRTGISIKVLPSRHYRIHYHDSFYYFSAGVWYRPSGSTFVVVRPPVGVIIPVLPSAYTTIWFHGVPYYYANDVYYVWRPDLNGYIVSEPPEASTADPVPLAEQLYIYPRQGQSEQQQADDRYACHRWGVEQTGYDPTRPPEGLSVNELSSKREAYQRAMRACLEGRGYSVR